MFSVRGVVSIVIILVTMPCVAAAATTEYSSQTTFETAFFELTGKTLNLESFEGLTATNSWGSGPAVTSEITVSVTTGLLGIYDQDLTSTKGWHATHLDNYLALGSFPSPNPAVVTTVTLTDPANSFGMTITDWGDYVGGVLTFTNNSGDNFTVAVAPLANANEMFYGVINTDIDFTQVTLSMTGAGEACSIDELLFGNCGEELYFHVDDFAGLNGGAAGQLVPVAGAKSLWCGARPTSVCFGLDGYASLPGYGNMWDQGFESVWFPRTGNVTVSFQLTFYTESGFDLVTLEQYSNTGTWMVIATWDNISGATPFGESIVIPSANMPAGQVKLRFRFVSDGGASDADGLWNSDGAVVIDQLRVEDSALIDLQDFESESVGATATNDGNWFAVKL